MGECGGIAGNRQITKDLPYRVTNTFRHLIPPLTKLQQTGIITKSVTMETYRSGHNEPDSKSGCRATGTRVRIPPSPLKKCCISALFIYSCCISCCIASSKYVLILSSTFTLSSGNVCIYTFFMILSDFHPPRS